MRPRVARFHTTEYQPGDLSVPGLDPLVACLGNPDPFIEASKAKTPGPRAPEARRICDSCAVLPDCLMWAMQDDDPCRKMIAAGLIHAERDRIRDRSTSMPERLEIAAAWRTGLLKGS